MQRRTFISTTILGVLSANQLLASTPIALHEPYTSKWFRLLEATNAKQRKRYLITDKKLKTAYKTAKKMWFLSGFRALGKEYFVCRNEELALFPIALMHATLGQIDFAVLVFEKTENNDWKKARSLSGFYVEALTKSLDSLTADTENLADYIFPTAATQIKNTQGYTTKKGSVNFNVRIIENEAIIDAKIMVNDEIVWNTKQDSFHAQAKK